MDGGHHLRSKRRVTTGTIALQWNGGLVVQAELHWIDDHVVRVGGVEFFATIEAGEYLTLESTARRFVLAKARPMLERLLAMTAPMTVRHIVELGIFKGGSTAFYAAVFAPEKLVAIERSVVASAALTEYLAATGLAGRVKPCYGIDQADWAALGAILAAEFPRRDVDLAIDDASHLFHETRASFNLVFPYLRPGGLYVIEDWGWAHRPGATWQEGGGYFQDKPALTNLIIELVMLAASRSDLIAEVTLAHQMAFIRRGDGQIEGEEFDLADHYLTRGRGFVASL